MRSPRNDNMHLVPKITERERWLLMARMARTLADHSVERERHLAAAARFEARAAALEEPKNA